MWLWITFGNETGLEGTLCTFGFPLFTKTIWLRKSKTQIYPTNRLRDWMPYGILFVRMKFLVKCHFEESIKSIRHYQSKLRSILLYAGKSWKPIVIYKNKNKNLECENETVGHSIIKTKTTIDFFYSGVGSYSGSLSESSLSSSRSSSSGKAPSASMRRAASSCSSWSRRWDSRWASRTSPGL